MTSRAQLPTLIFGIGLRRAVFAVAMVCSLATITMLPAQAQTFTVLHSFTGGADGRAPDSGVIVDASGTVYGVTAGGGSVSNCAFGCGTVFRLAKRGSAWLFTTLYNFQGEPDGYLPVGIVKGPDGTLYGATMAGGQGSPNCSLSLNGCGTVFNLRPSASFCKNVVCSWNETVLYRFKGLQFGDGAFPSNGTFAFDSSGNLYGTASEGGTQNYGTVFQLAHSAGGWTETTLYSFNGAGSSGWGYPESGPLLDRSSGALYGTTTLQTQFAGGVVYELSPSGGGWTASVLHGFQCSGVDGCAPGGLVRDASGNLYVGTAVGGSNGGGTADELLASEGWSLNTLFSFTGTGGSGPQGTLAMDAAGNLYGATDAEGLFGAGTVFKLTPAAGGWSMTVLHNFTGGSDGGYPVSGVVLDSNGNIFGTTNAGGNGVVCTRGCGVVWEITQ